mgnify:CR=1 FL=1
MTIFCVFLNLSEILKSLKSQQIITQSLVFIQIIESLFGREEYKDVKVTPEKTPYKNSTKLNRPITKRTPNYISSLLSS